MDKLMSAVCVLVSMIVCCCDGYRYGPPMEACSSMFPTGHVGHKERTDTPPFSFYLSQKSYTPGEIITVTLKSSINPDKWFMAGVLIQARTLDNTLKESFGTFSVPKCDDFLQTIDCFEKPNSAIRHYTHINVTEKTFTWTAPSQPVGHIYLRATVAHNQKIFWTNVFSDPILDPNDVNANLKPEAQSASNFVKLDILAMAVLGLIAYFV